MLEDELSIGTVNLVHSIERRYPDLTPVEARKLGGVVVEEVGRRIAAGEQLAFVRRDKGGNAELTVLGLEVLRKRRGGAR